MHKGERHIIDVLCSDAYNDMSGVKGQGWGYG